MRAFECLLVPVCAYVSGFPLNPDNKDWTPGLQSVQQSGPVGGRVLRGNSPLKGLHDGGSSMTAGGYMQDWN